MFIFYYFRSAIVTVIITSVVAVVSVTLNVALFCKIRLKSSNKNRKKKTYKRATSSNGSVFLFQGQQYSSLTSSTPSDDCDETALIEKPKDFVS